MEMDMTMAVVFQSMNDGGGMSCNGDSYGGRLGRLAVIVAVEWAWIGPIAATPRGLITGNGGVSVNGTPELA